MASSPELEQSSNIQTVEEFKEFLSNPGEPRAEFEMISNSKNAYKVGFYKQQISLDLDKVTEKIEDWLSIPSCCFNTMNSPAHGEEFKRSYIATTIDNARRYREDNMKGVFSQFDYQDIENSLMIVRFEQ
jgi:hypothetical protein